MWCKATFEQPAELVEADPGNFFVRLDRDVDWDVVASLLEAGYRQVAPKR